MRRTMVLLCRLCAEPEPSPRLIPLRLHVSGGKCNPGNVVGKCSMRQLLLVVRKSGFVRDQQIASGVGKRFFVELPTDSRADRGSGAPRRFSAR